jgi:hypothetical protein
MLRCDRAARQVHEVAIPLLLATAVVALALSWYWQTVRPWRLFGEEMREMRVILDALAAEPPPPGVDPQAWKNAWGLTGAGLGNACFSPSWVSIDELRRLHTDMEEHAKTTRSFEYMRWFWHRLAETSPSGKEYIERMTPVFDECITSVEGMAKPSSRASREECHANPTV